MSASGRFPESPASRPLGARGQTTTEWLMIAGLLTAVGIFLLRVIPDGIRVYAVSLISSLRTIAP